MRMFIIQGIALSFFSALASAADQQEAEIFTYKAKTEIGNRVVIDAPFAQIGEKEVWIASDPAKGICTAYGFGKTVGLTNTSIYYDAWVLTIDDSGSVVNFGLYSNAKVVRGLVCEKK